MRHHSSGCFPFAFIRVHSRLSSFHTVHDPQELRLFRSCSMHSTSDSRGGSNLGSGVIFPVLLHSMTSGFFFPCFLSLSFKFSPANAQWTRCSSRRGLSAVSSFSNET